MSKAKAGAPGTPAATPATPVAAVVTWKGGDEKSKEAAVRAFARAIGGAEQPYEISGAKRDAASKRASAANTFLNIESPSISVRDGFDRDDYEYFRDGEEEPKTPKQGMLFGMRAYQTVGIVRNVFDLMTDFAAKGVGVEHPSEAANDFYQAWWKKVRGYERTCAFLKQLFLNNNVIVRRHVGKITAGDVAQWRRAEAGRAEAARESARDPSQTPAQYSDPAQAPPGAGHEADERVPKRGRQKKREIPIRYSFLNPLHVDLEDESLATFIGPEACRYSVRLPATLVNRIRNPRDEKDRRMLALLPDEVRDYVKSSGSNRLPLNPRKVSVFHYKKDDWDGFAMPFIGSIHADLNILKKMKMADLSALDGAISSIRVWKLGSVEAGIYPPESVIQRLAEMLANNVAGGIVDLVWGPDIDLLETATEVYKFLGDTKYAPVLNAIFQGLGIPATLNGTGARPGTGYTNNYMSLQTFIERLEYGRQIAREFWLGELALVQQAMGHRKPANLFFDSVLTDEAQILKLYMDMADRNIISDETLQEMLNLQPDIERIRVRKEARARESGRKPAKAGPYHDANADLGLWKILAQTGAYTPEALGLEAFLPESNQEPPAEKTAKITKKYTPKPPPGAGPFGNTPGAPGKPGPAAGPKGTPGQGRPAGQKDQSQRKQKKVNPRRGRPGTAGAASDEIVLAMNRAQAQLAAVAEATTPLYLAHLKKKTMRELTGEESDNFEHFKFALLCSLDPEDRVTAGLVEERCASEFAVPPAVDALYRKTVQAHLARYGRAPALEETRYYMAGIHALKCMSPGDDEEGDDGEPAEGTSEEATHVEG